MSNIREVARLAGVSVATVSRTLSNPERVLPATRDKVNLAVEQAGYRPNLMAVQFRSRRTGNLVILVPVIANIFFARVISGAQQAAQASGLRLLLCDTQGDEDTEKQFAELVYAHQADGLVQLRASNPFEAGTPGSTTPWVNACEILPEAPCPTISLDNRSAGRCMTEHLLSLGHRRIGLIKGPAASPLTQQRVAGYEDALRQARIEVDLELQQLGDFSLQSGYAAVDPLLALAEPPTALFCENDEMAIGAMKRLRELGLRIPADISVAGFDDIPIAEYCDPPLTTIAQPAEEFGRQAVQRLIAILDNNELAERHTVLPFELKLRGSTGPVR